VRSKPAIKLLHVVLMNNSIGYTTVTPSKFVLRQTFVHPACDDNCISVNTCSEHWIVVQLYWCP